MIELTINGEKGEFEEGFTLLKCLEQTGIKVPTLCNHKALTPYGACRLCLVEVEKDGGSSSLQASCSHPAQNGLVVKTDTERVRRARRIMAELLLARCPDSAVIRRIASEQGVEEPRINKKHDDCVYCGLCERMCHERMGRKVISFSGRGPRKKLEPPFGMHNEQCWACGACDFICPVGKKVSALTSDKELIPILNSYNMDLDTRPAVHILYPQAVPLVPTIDKDKCIHLQYGDCKICQEICEAKAIDFEQEEKTFQLNVGGVILAPGFEVFDAAIKEDLGYGRFTNVLHALEFERILSASGPYAGEVMRPSDHKHPEKIAWIQCVGSRDADRDYCSSVCCMYATKEAIIAKEHIGDEVQCDIFFMDIRAYSKGFDEYYQRAKELGVNYIRCRPPRVEEIPESGNLVIQYLGDDEKKYTGEYDMVILSVGMLSPKASPELASIFGIALNEYNFCKTSAFSPAESSRGGIYVAGPFSEPKDIPETVMQASGASSNILSLLKDERGSLIIPKEYPPEIDISGQETRIGVFVCHCGTNIGGVVNVPEVVEYAKSLSDVAYAESNLYTCSNDAQERIKGKITENKLNRVIVASCTPRTHEPLFANTLRETGLNPYLFEMANIRDQCSWVHMFEKDKASDKAKDLVRMAVAKARMLEPLEQKSISINKSALVIGGGIAGMTAARDLGKMGFRVYLIEKEKELGGNLRRIRYLIDGENPQEALESIIREIETAEGIEVLTGSTFEYIEGSIGNFHSVIGTPGGKVEFDHGVVVVATGAAEYHPEEYLYGGNKDVITQLELEERLATNPGWFSSGKKEAPKTVVMIQCVGSRDSERPYCSRICCIEAVKNTLKIKEAAPETNIYVLYRDIRTYGFKESYYTEAREKGVVFIRYEEDQKPEVEGNGAGFHVTVMDQVLKIPIEIESDLVVLSAGIVPATDNEAIGKFLKIPLTTEKFFLEAHMKLRPIDFATEGVFLCGLAHSPKRIEESVTQAQAAASRAATILSNDMIDLEAKISKVVDENCDGCAFCVEPCPFNAITLIEYIIKGAVKKTIQTDETACKGCGCCMATCPKQGVYVKGFKLEQIAAQVEAALEA